MKSSKRYEFLNLRTLPAQLNGQQAAWLLGFSPRDIPALVAVRLLIPLTTAARRRRAFALATVRKLAMDSRWLDQATDVAAAARQAKARERAKKLAR